MLGNNHPDVREGHSVRTLSLNDETALGTEAPAKDQIAGPEAAARCKVVKCNARGDIGGRLLKSRKKLGRGFDERTLDALISEDDSCGNENGAAVRRAAVRVFM